MPHSKNRLARQLLPLSPGLRPESGPRQFEPFRSTRPLYFGEPSRPLFGWLRLPESGYATSLALLICNPFGNEAICSDRTLRHIAERACESGLPVLRFDYDGTGDSAGNDHDPDRVQAWLGSVEQATDELRRITGAERVCLLGIRLGATLAATVAVRRNDIEALIAIAPVVTGKAYVREMRLLQRAMEAKRDAAPTCSDDFLEAAGFVLTATTQSALGALDLMQLEKAPAPRILVLKRAEMPSDAKWARHLETRGAQVTCKSVSGYTEMMLDSHESVIPEEMLTTTFDWLQGVMPPKPIAAQRVNTALLRPPPDDAPEQAVHFGADRELFGIVTRPPAGSFQAGNAKAILLINSGAVHRVGPNRLYVTMARHFAERGYLVLRMDITGLGDSPARPDAQENVVYSKHALQDVSAALDYLRHDWGITHIHAMGLCSGAYNAFKAAVAGLPLDAVTLVNPLTFFWKEGMSLKYAEHRVAGDIVRYRTNALRLGAWLKLLRGGVNVWELSQVIARRAHSVALNPLRALARLLRISLKDDLPTELRSAVRHGLRLQFVFSDSDPGLELLRTLGGRTVSHMGSRGALKIHTIEGADHTFTSAAARTELLAALERVLT